MNQDTLNWQIQYFQEYHCFSIERATMSLLYGQHLVLLTIRHGTKVRAIECMSTGWLKPITSERSAIVTYTTLYDIAKACAR